MWSIVFKSNIVLFLFRHRLRPCSIRANIRILNVSLFNVWMFLSCDLWLNLAAPNTQFYILIRSDCSDILFLIIVLGSDNCSRRIQSSRPQWGSLPLLRSVCGGGELLPHTRTQSRCFKKRTDGRTDLLNKVKMLRPPEALLKFLSRDVDMNPLTSKRLQQTAFNLRTNSQFLLLCYLL